jgi:hypothetical protein
VSPSGKGYWIATSDGSVISFGDAKRLGFPVSIDGHPIRADGEQADVPGCGGAAIAIVGRDSDDRLLNEVDDSDNWPAPAMYALSAVVYVERGDEILLLQRAKAPALAASGSSPAAWSSRRATRRRRAARVGRRGGCRDRRARDRRLLPHARLRTRMLQDLLPRTVSEECAVVVSHEHDGARWVKASDMRALLTDEVLDQMARGEERILTLLRHIRADLDRYLARVASG